MRGADFIIYKRADRSNFPFVEDWPKAAFPDRNYLKLSTKYLGEEIYYSHDGVHDFFAPCCFFGLSESSLPLGLAFAEKSKGRLGQLAARWLATVRQLCRQSLDSVSGALKLKKGSVIRLAARLQ